MTWPKPNFNQTCQVKFSGYLKCSYKFFMLPETRPDMITIFRSIQVRSKQAILQWDYIIIIIDVYILLWSETIESLIFTHPSKVKSEIHPIPTALKMSSSALYFVRIFYDLRILRWFNWHFGILIYYQNI